MKGLVLLRPEALLLLLLVPLFAWLAFRGRRARAAEQAAVATRSFLLLVVALALSLPRIEFETRFRSVAYVLDVSDSIPAAELSAVKEYVRRSASKRGDEDDASLVVFADGKATEAPMARISATIRSDPVPIDPANIATRIGTGETDIEAGLGEAAAGFPPGGARGVVLVTDGNETRGKAVAAVRDMLAAGTEVHVLPVRYTRKDEVWVEKVVTPATAPENAPVPIRVVIRSTYGGAKAHLKCRVDGVVVQETDVTLDEGRNAYELSAPFTTPGIHSIELDVEPERDGDPVNNRGAAATIVRGKGRVLAVSNAEGSPLTQALAAGLGIDVDATGPSGLPADPGGYVPYDALVLENVPAWMLSEGQRACVRAAVEDLGVGLVVVGGPLTFGPGGYGGSDIEAVLPVTSDVQNRRVLPSGALVVAMHSCEFPDGNSIGREVTRLAIQALSAEDEMGLIEFAGYGPDGDRWVIPLTRVGDKQRHLAMVSKSQPSDAPSLDSILRKAADALIASNAAARHIIVVSDGDPQPPSDKLIGRMVDAKITVTTVCVDPHTPDGPSAMRRVADETGGNAYSIQSKARDKLPQIFIKEAVTVRRSAWSEEPFQPVLRGVHRMVRELGEQDFPQLQGHVVTSIRPEAELILSGPQDDPILATWRRGLGQGTAWTADATMRWAPAWVAWPGYGRFWTQVVRSSLRSVERPTARAHVEIDGGSARVVLDVLRDDGSYQNGLRPTGRAIGPDGRPAEFKLSQTGQGRYEGAFPATAVGTHLATVTWTDPDDPSGTKLRQAQAPLCVAYSAEHLAQSSNERLFAELEAAGAKILDLDRLERDFAANPSNPDPATIPWASPPRATDDPLDLWPWIAGLGALVLVVDVAVRRLRIDWKKLLPGKAGPAAPKGPVAKGEARAPAAGAYVAPDAPVEIAGSGTPPPVPPQAAVPPVPRPQDAGGLLDVKRRAQRKQKWEENQ